MLLNKDQILQADDLKSMDVAVPEWGGTVRVRALAGEDRDAIQALFINADGSKKDVPSVMNVMKYQAIARSVVDENGVRVLADADVEHLSKKSSAALDRVFAAVESLSAVAGTESDAIAKN